ncbi:DUF3280 domain-containing protein [Hansschlegelia sp.]|uniref:DUF3280 domain-containing protein n=1 Tax=Hansschlegelia sp. TaxID=2041892 RepID=UPI002C03A52F|nr:DUF3280 domain-containing protein [Hansschlegelia sp.]HVI29191.1 DUF3280 domain-containing protein [Hansschlegelia sp.]
MHRIIAIPLLGMLVAPCFALSAEASPPKAAVFKFELVDTSLEGEMDGVRADQTQRLARTADQVRDALQSAGIELVDVAPADGELADVKSLRDCKPCAQKAAARLGADFAVIGYVQKVSNLILNINLEVVDAKTGQIVRGGSTDIRGNTNEMWAHGVKVLLRDQILNTPLPEAHG